MYTYKKPYRQQEYTKEFIEERGRLALSRALNIGRVIAFVGSGVTTAYGRPSWRDLVRVGIDALIEAIKPLEKEGRPRRPDYQDQRRVLDLLYERIQRKEEASDTLILALGTAERIARLLGLEDVIRMAIALELAKGRHTARATKFKEPLAGWIGGPESGPPCPISPQASPLRAMIEDLDIRRFMTLNFDVEVEREFARLFRIANKSTERRYDTDSEADDVFRGLIDAARGEPVALSETWRTAGKTLETLDGLLESARKKGVGGLDDLSKEVAAAKAAHAGGDPGDLQPRVRRFLDDLRFSDGAGQSVQSVNLSSDNIGDLVNFALLPRRYGAQVFHLHGRYDDPKSMVLTERDYQRRYHGPGEKSFSFEEALKTVFQGNDILLVGVGMSEADMFRPLRQFAGQNAGRDLSARNVYVLRECSARFEIDLANPGGSRGSPEADYLQDTEFSLKMKTQYDVSTIFYGKGALRHWIRLAAIIRQIGKRAKAAQDADGGKLSEAEADGAAALLRALVQDTRRPAGREIAADDAALLRKNELDWLAERLNAEADCIAKERKPSADAPEIEAWANAFESVVRSRALAHALSDLERRRSDWWEDWRQVPAPRDTRFRKTYTAGDRHKRYPCMSRHRPRYTDLPDGRDPNEFDVLKELRRQAEAQTSQPKGMPKGRRILRVSMQRGAGKGALMHLLQQPLGKGSPQERRVYDTLFPFDGSEFRYHGAFLVHLSFSMEFASVVNALTRFLEGALVGLFVDADTRRAALDALGGLKGKADNGLVLQALQDSRGDLEKLGAGTDEMSISERLRHKVEFGEPPSESNARSHRVEMCRSYLEGFTALVQAMPDTPGIRLFLCFSGLDRLCDESGTAYNPMYRAFFRLLSGEGVKTADESSDDYPFDLLLISGHPKKPVRYLSREPSEAELEVELAGPRGPMPHYQRFRRLDGAGIYLEYWPEIEGFPIRDRFWLSSPRDGEYRRPHQAFCAILVERTDPKVLESGALPPEATIRQYLARGVALSSWCAGAFEADFEANALRLEREGRRADRGAEKIKSEANAFLQRLDDAADKTGMPGIIGVVIAAHRKHCRETWETARRDYPDPAAIERWPHARADLLDLVLRHLALFPMPVELRVLYGCDDIHFLLHRIVDARDPNSSGRPREDSREECLIYLDEMLNTLVDRFLLIAVRPKVEPEFDDEDAKARWRRTHTRYILQNQLRDYVGAQMDLAVPDRGERNFFQVSLYCDQPKDLPTPTADHYRLFRQIIDRQIQHCRNTLWCLHQVRAEDQDHSYAQNPLTVRSELALTGLMRRVAGDTPVSEDATEVSIDDTLASLNAVPQRLRAMYGLLRGSFSVGAITRLDHLDEDDLRDEPLERFGGWLRGVTNAATSMGKLAPLTERFASASKAGGAPLTLKYTDQTCHFRGTQTAPQPAPSQPLYRDEFGWLFNERGVIALVQGKLYDAIPHFERAINVMNHRDQLPSRDASLHAAVRRVTLNLAIAQIERGNLTKARQMIGKLLLPGERRGHFGSTVSWIGSGYLGLIKHLGGDHSGALAAYDRVIELAEEREMLRLQCIFRRHRADLNRQMRRPDAAAADSNMAIAAAKHAEQRDLFWGARLTQVKHRIDHPEGNDPHATQTLEDCLAYARTMAIPRLESEALRLQAALLLRYGDRVLAGQLAASAAAIASRAGLRLMKVAAMREYGRVLEERGNLANAGRVLTEANREAERRGYLNHFG